MQVLIQIRGTQVLEGEEPDTVELTTHGTLEPEGDGWILTYRENEDTGIEYAETKLHVAGERVLLERTGEHANYLVLEKHRRHHSHYDTPYGMFDIGTYATALEWNLNKKGGQLYFAYTLGFNESVNSTHTVRIHVQEDKTPCPLS